MLRRTAAVAAFAAAVALASGFASTASAAKGMKVGLFDDGRVLYGVPEDVFRQLQATGTQAIRVNLWWAGPALSVALRKPKRAQNPADPAYNWDTYDRTVRFAVANGMEPIFSIVGTPPWANAAKGWNVAPDDPNDLRLFVQAVAKRYSGTYVIGGGYVLPRVSKWIAWNEPNNPVFLKPQYAKEAGAWTIASATAYAAICNAVVQGVKSVHRESLVACGATSPRGNNNPNSSRPSTSPLPFARALKAAGAKGFDAWAHHPYYGSPAETPVTPPPTGPRGQQPTAVTLGNFDVLVQEVDALWPKLRFWITEYGYQTNPPDTFFGVPPAKQAKYLEQAVAVARAHPAIDLFLWFLLQDETRAEGWQSGLLTEDGVRKPAWDAFRRAARG
ncbi:MAG: hypothetical protein EXQ77_04835 [Thermoleophilia bacterium]|nr:hypothetical protein [Thermoleophilia bacterium]